MGAQRQAQYSKILSFANIEVCGAVSLTAKEMEVNYRALTVRSKITDLPSSPLETHASSPLETHAH